MLTKLWVENYRPTTIDEYIFQNDTQKSDIEKYIREGSFPHLIFVGSAGTGKTSLAFLLQNELGIPDGDFKVINASHNNSVDYVREKIPPFISTMPIGDTAFKVVFFDEADFLTPSAQKALCRMMEEHSDTVRFIFTCNRPHKILPEIIDSRCVKYVFKGFDKKQIARHIYKHILVPEGIEVKDAALLMEYVEEGYPDMRNIIQSIEVGIENNALRELVDLDGSDRVLLEIVEQLSDNKWLEVRESIVNTIEDDGWDTIYRFLYDNIDQVTGFDTSTNWKKAIVIIADHLRFHGQVADPEINFSACMVRLSGVVDE